MAPMAPWLRPCMIYHVLVNEVRIRAGFMPLTGGKIYDFFIKKDDCCLFFLAKAEFGKVVKIFSGQENLSKKNLPHIWC